MNTRAASQGLRLFFYSMSDMWGRAFSSGAEKNCFCVPGAPSSMLRNGVFCWRQRASAPLPNRESCGRLSFSWTFWGSCRSMPVRLLRRQWKSPALTLPKIFRDFLCSGSFFCPFCVSGLFGAGFFPHGADAFLGRRGTCCTGEGGCRRGIYCRTSGYVLWGSGRALEAVLSFCRKGTGAVP